MGMAILRVGTRDVEKLLGPFDQQRCVACQLEGLKERLHAAFKLPADCRVDAVAEDFSVLAIMLRIEAPCFRQPPKGGHLFNVQAFYSQTGGDLTRFSHLSPLGDAKFDRWEGEAVEGVCLVERSGPLTEAVEQKKASGKNYWEAT